jgi:hypothetical protein
LLQEKNIKERFMSLKIFLLMVLTGIPWCLCAMEECYVICVLCRQVIIDESNAIKVFDQGRQGWVHNSCFKKFSTPGCDVLEDHYYDSDDERKPVAAIPPVCERTGDLEECPQCCWVFERIIQILRRVFLDKNTQ